MHTGTRLINFPRVFFACNKRIKTPSSKILQTSRLIMTTRSFRDTPELPNCKRPKLTTRELTELEEILSDSDNWDDESDKENKKVPYIVPVPKSNITMGKFAILQNQMSQTVVNPQNSQNIIKTNDSPHTPKREPGKGNKPKSTNIGTQNKFISDSDALYKLLASDSSPKEISLISIPSEPKIKYENKILGNIQQSSPLQVKPSLSRAYSTQIEGVRTPTAGIPITEIELENPPDRNSILDFNSSSIGEMAKSEISQMDNEPSNNDNISSYSKSIEVIQENLGAKYSNKFTLVTQAATVGNLEEREKKLHLPSNTKVKIPIRLSVEQEHIIDLAEKGYNIFYTGSAGTGKSVLLKQMIKKLKLKYGPEHVAVTASTGLAACNIGGFTIHSYTGIGLGKGEADALYKKVRRSRKHLRRWENISALVVDEVSMLDGDLLDKLDHIAQKIRKNHAPFGGIQLIFCGDFFQLPPVSKDPRNPTKFAFESRAWRNSIEITIMLQKVFRQQGDLKFIEMLNKMRLGKIDEETEREFKKLNRELPDDDIIPAELYSTRNEVDRANNSRLMKLPGKTHIFRAIDGGDLKDEELRDKLLQNFLAPRELQLKIGAQVIMIKNIDAKLVNGSLGKVIDFIDADTYFFYDILANNPESTAEDLEKLRRDPQLLQELKEQAEAEDEGSGTKKNKLTKDAFTRYSNDDSLAPLGDSIFDFLNEVDVQDSQIRSNLERKKEWLKEVHASSSGRKLPLVRFKMADLTTRTVLVEPENWAIEDENEKPLVSRVQLPLMLAWSLSIHKSQGQTLPKVKVDLRRVFEKGQAYVALSRAVSREGLQVLNFDKTRILAHEKVIEFYMTMMSVEAALEKMKKDPPKTRLPQRKLEFAPSRPSFNKNTKREYSTSSRGNKIIDMLKTRKEKSKH